MIARISSAAAALAMLILLGAYMTTAGKVSTAERAGLTAVVTAEGRAPATKQFDLSIAAAAAAVRSDPLNQRLVNAAMIAKTREDHERSPDDWIAALSDLGWRDTPSRQNILFHHALAGNIGAALDDVDGLLRRNRLIEEVSPVLIAMESDPQWQAQIVQRLRQHPAWRFGYLQRGSLIDDRTQLAARARTIRMLQATGDDVSEGEIAPVLPKMLAAKLGSQAFAIWRVRDPSIETPVADPRFAHLAAERSPTTVPFRWQLTSGPDYSIDAGSRTDPQLSISWNGSGAPIFASQYVSAPAGRYAVVLQTGGDAGKLASVLGVRMVCGDTVIDLPRVRLLAADRIAFTGEKAVPCPFARMELFGHSGEGSRFGDRSAVVSNIAIRRLI